MADEEKPRSWWHTLPGLITSLTATITAIAGLLLALKQVGLIGSAHPTPPTAPTQQQATRGPGESAGSADLQADGARSVTLPAQRDYRLKTATFTLLGATLERYNAERDALRIQVRMMNHDTNDANFWDRSFRLILDGTPRAPESHLNLIAAGRAAKDGEVMFVVPRTTTHAQLEISFYDQQTLVPLVLASRK